MAEKVDRQLIFMDCNANGAFALGLRAAGLRCTLAIGPTDGHCLNFILNNREECEDQTYSLPIDKKALPNVVRLTSSAHLPRRVRPKERKRPRQEKPFFVPSRLKTTDYKDVDEKNLSEGVFVIGKAEDIAKLPPYTNRIALFFRKITKSLDLMTSISDVRESTNHRLKIDLSEMTAFVSTVRMFRPKIALRVIPYRDSIPYAYDEFKMTIRPYDGMIRHWSEHGYVVLPILTRPSVFGASVSRKQCILMGIRNDVFNKIATSGLLSEKDVKLWSKQAFLAHCLQRRIRYNVEWIKFDHLDIEGMIDDDAFVVQSISPFVLDAFSAKGTVFEDFVSHTLVEPSLERALNRGLCSEPFWQPSQEELVKVNSQGSIACELDETIFSVGVEQSGDLTQPKVDKPFALSEEKKFPSPILCVVDPIQNIYAALSRALVGKKYNSWKRPTLKAVINAYRGECHMESDVYDPQISDEQIRRWLFIRVFQVIEHSTPRVPKEDCMTWVTFQLAEKIRVALKNLLDNHLTFTVDDQGHWKMDGSKANRFLIGGTLLAFNDPKLEAFVCEMRQACEDGELFDNYRVSLKLMNQYVVLKRNKTVETLPTTQNCSRVWHPDIPRLITVNEFALCQGYPMGFRFNGDRYLSSNEARPRLCMYEEVTHTMSPIVAYAFGELVKRIIGEYDRVATAKSS